LRPNLLDHIIISTSNIELSFCLLSIGILFPFCVYFISAAKISADTYNFRKFVWPEYPIRSCASFPESHFLSRPFLFFMRPSAVRAVEHILLPFTVCADNLPCLHCGIWKFLRRNVIYNQVGYKHFYHQYGNTALN